MSKGTHMRNVRVSDELWDVAKVKAESEGRTLSGVIRESLQAYVEVTAPYGQLDAQVVDADKLSPEPDPAQAVLECIDILSDALSDAQMTLGRAMRTISRLKGRDD
ncbi:hypothetical protein [Rhodococcus opacus]|uniref:hypothetical protein n=1 Tax=Rhodococcus opacus TaxID=37919 RepID=UPI00247666C1|nr:hypothetical protein [Rhodococcus opacus]MDH6291902.1 hypothetical protein [Rhodococcus opacus]